MSKFHPRPWRRGSEFGTGPRVPLDRERRAQWRAKLLLQRRPGRLTIGAVAVGRVLLDLLGQDGRLDPCIDRLAELARVSRATAVRALAQLRQAGFLDWTRRLVRSAATGWRTEQVPNAYVLRVPACDAHFAPPVKCSGFRKMLGNGDAPAPSTGSDAWAVWNRDRQVAALVGKSSVLSNVV